jgi:glutathione peroxidase
MYSVVILTMMFRNGDWKDLAYLTLYLSLAGYTKEHYKQMISLHSKFRGDGFEILAFPCNQFREQEPDSNSKIQEFCDKRRVLSFV